MNINKIKRIQEITIEIKEKPSSKEIFRILPTWKKPTQRIKDDMRQGW